MGFLEGFADGFAPAYAQSFKADKDKEETLLASGLADFKARQKQFAEAKADDAQRIKTAENLTSEYGFGPEMKSYIYIRLSNGETLPQIRGDLDSGKFTTADGKPLTRAGMKTGTVDQQTTDAGLAPPAAPKAVGGEFAPGEKPKTLFYAEAIPTSDYGVKRPTGNHGGIDFAMPKSTPVGALQGGVAKRGYDDKSGNYVSIVHPDGHVSTYAHLDGYNIKDGQEVAAGEVVGFSGNTGRVRGANGGYHLHVGVRDPKGNRIDPRGFIKDSLDKLSANQATTAAQPEANGPSDQFKAAFADVPVPAEEQNTGELPPATSTATPEQAPSVGQDIVVEGRTAQEAPTTEQPKKKGDGFGYDAAGRAKRAVVDAAGGMEVYNQILGGYNPDPVESNVRFQPGRKQTGMPTLEQLRVMRAQAKADGNPEEVTRLDGMISDVVGSQAQGDALKDRQWVRYVIPSANGGAKFGTGYVATDANGKPVLMNEQGTLITDPNARRVDDTELSARSEVIKATEASNARYRDTLTATADALPLVSDILDIAKRDPRVLTTTASIVGKVKSLGTEVVTAFNVVEGIMAAKSKGDPNAAVYVTEQEVESGLRRAGYLAANETLSQRAKRTFSMGNDANTLAENAKLMEAKLLLSAVRFGAMEGQSGQGFSNKDFDRFLTMVGGGSNNVNTFTTNLTDYVRGRIDNINVQARTLNDPRTGLAAQFRQTYGYNPAPAVPTLNQVVSDMGGKHSAALARITGKPAANSGGGAAPKATGRSPASGDSKNPDVLMKDGRTYTRVGKTPQGKPVYRGSDGKNYVF